MIYYLLLPFLSILLIVLQNTAADIIFSGRLILELSIIIVIYTGFRFDLVKGAISTLILGFVFDCISGSVLGLFTLIYVLIFLFSFFVSARLVTEKMHFIALFTLLCAFLEEFTVVLFYKLTYDFDILHGIPVSLFLQALIVGLLAPVFFYIMRKVEVVFYGKPAQSAKWAGTGRIPAET
ncbi:MAG: rod shape-determining protein MreD [Smithellaceae bacterium]